MQQADELLDEKIEAILTATNRMTLATSSDGNSSAATVFFARDKGDLIFFTFNTSRKAEQIRVNPHVQAVVRPEGRDELQALQIEGRCYQIKDEKEQQKAYELIVQTTDAFRPLMDDAFLKQNKVTGYYRLKPYSIKYVDFDMQPPFVWREYPQNRPSAVKDALQTFYTRLMLWVRAVRAPFFTATLVPVLLGSVIAYTDLQRAAALQFWNWTHFWLVLIGAIFSQAGTNLGNDYFDHTSHNDEFNKSFSPFNGGSRMIQAGLIKPWKVLFAAAFFFMATVFIGFNLNAALNGAYLANSPLLWIGIAGVALGFLYTGHPVRLGYRGWGELSIALGFGPLMVLGAHYVLTAPYISQNALSWNWQMPLLASVPVAILIMLVVWINQFQDLPADKEVGKNTWVVRLSGIKDNHVDYEKPFLYYIYFTNFSFGFILLLGVIGFFRPQLSTPFVLISLLPVILARKAIKWGLEWLERWNKPGADRQKLPYELLKVNVSTIGVHLFTGSLLVIGYLLQLWI